MPTLWQKAFRQGFAFVWALAFLAVAQTSPALALAEARIHDRETRNDPTQLGFEPVCNIRLDGKIESGDFEAVKATFDTFVADRRVAPVIARIEQQLAAEKPLPPLVSRRAVDRSFYALCLSSPGGDLKEAMKIASLFNGWMMVVGVDPLSGTPDHCFSACAVLFMTAKRRDGLYESNYHKRYPGRFLHHQARLGFHAPELEFPSNHGPTVTTKEAENAYAAAITSIREIIADQPSPHAPHNWDRATLGRHRGVDFPAGLLVEMLTTPPSTMSEIEFVGEAVDWGIELFGFAPPAVMTDRLVMTVCSNLAWKRCDHSESEDRCDESFVTASQRPANATRGVKALFRQLSGPNAILPPTPEPQLQSDRTAIEEMMRTWTITPATLWPTTGTSRVRIQSAMLQAAPGTFGAPRPCAVVATFDGDRLANVEAQTFNGSWHYWLKEHTEGPALGILDDYHQATEAGIASGQYRADTPEHVPLTRMLPGKARLSDLAAQPWAWHDKGKPIFSDSPLRWP